MTCPQCTSSDIRRSSNPSWKDVLPSLLGQQPYRCRKCRHRFFARPSTQLAANGRKNQADPISKKRKMRRLFRTVLAFAVVVLMFSLFGFFLRYITADHAPKGDEPDMVLPDQ